MPEIPADLDRRSSGRSLNLIDEAEQRATEITAAEALERRILAGLGVPDPYGNEAAA